MDEPWSYALLRKPTVSQRTIDREVRRQLGRLKHKSLVPGWAQFVKRENRKGWTILALEGISVIGGAVSSVLWRDARDKSYEARNIEDRRHYDKLKDRYRWMSVGFWIGNNGG